MADKTLSCLMLDKENDGELIKQLREAAKNTPKVSKEGSNTTRSKDPPTPDNLKKIANDLISKMKQRNEARSSVSLSWECLERVRDIIKSVLEEYNDEESENLLKQLNSVSTSKQDDEGQSGELKYWPLKVNETSVDSMKDDYNKKLVDEEKRCLRALCLLPEGVMVSKTQFFHWCVGLDILGYDYKDDLLSKFVEMGFVKQIATTRINLSKRYKVRSSEVKELILKITSPDLKQTRSANNRFSEVQQIEGNRIVAVMNMDETIIDEYSLEHMSQKMDSVKVLLLGNLNWEGGKKKEENKIIVGAWKEPPEHAFNEVKHVKYVSLRGMFKMMKLPGFISVLKEHLLILDLSQCHNLMSLPSDIQYLTNLRHLDLSQCYVLEHIPTEISLLKNLVVLKGFIIQADPSKVERRPNKLFKCKTSSKKVSTASSPTCPLSELRKLEKLQKLTIRTRRMDFPSKEDVTSLGEIKSLTKLGIAWVGNPGNAQIDSDLNNFPNKITKLELHSATHQTMSGLLQLIHRSVKECGLKKLYIKGGGIRDLSSVDQALPSVETLRLRYLSNFDTRWDEFKNKFPNLGRLEVFECPYLAWSACDENGIWVKKK